MTFESNSQLTRIGSEIFSYSSLQSIVIPRNVQFIDGSAFIDLTLFSISVESGNDIFVVEKGVLIDVLHHKLIRNFSTFSAIEVGMNIEIVGSGCFSYCESLSSITFGSNSQLTRIESFALSDSSLQSILIPRNVEILEPYCFSFCKSLSSITCESNSHLTRIKSGAFSFSSSSLQIILVPSTILFIASDAADLVSQITLVDGVCCPEFDRWIELQRSGIAIDFRRIERVGFDIRCLRDYIVNLSGFEERSMICESNEISSQIYHRIEDELLVSLISKPLSADISESEIENEIEKLFRSVLFCRLSPTVSGN
jgi:uncharacterized protein YuzB (UPF0349 family)